MVSHGHAAVTQWYFFKDLGTLGGSNSGAYAINNAGQITGFSELPAHGGAPAVRRAVVWNGLTVTNLGVGTGYAINAAGHVAGLSIDSSGNEFATLWVNATPTLLGAGRAYALNDQDEVAGSLRGADDIRRPAVWRNGVATTLSSLPGEASGINGLGQIVGATNTSNEPNIATSTAMRWAGDVAQTLGLHTGAYGINDAGVVLGAYNNSIATVAAMWSAKPFTCRA